MADYSVFSDIGLGFDTSGFFAGMGVAMPIIMFILVIAGLLFVSMWLIKFKFHAVIYSQRSDGNMVKKRDRGGFFKNRRTGIESFRLMRDSKAFVAPIPNKFLIREDGKDYVYLFRTTGREYIPMTFANHSKFLKPIVTEDNLEDKDGNIIQRTYTTEYKEEKDFIVHTDWVRNWLAMQAKEDEMRFSAGDWVNKYGPIILPMILVAAFIFTMHYSAQVWEIGMKNANAIARQNIPSVSMLLPIVSTRLIKWIKG